MFDFVSRLVVYALDKKLWFCVCETLKTLNIHNDDNTVAQVYNEIYSRSPTINIGPVIGQKFWHPPSISHKNPC